MCFLNKPINVDLDACRLRCEALTYAAKVIGIKM
jgi:hypothetical protein